MPNATKATVAKKNFFIAFLHLRRFDLSEAIDAFATADNDVVDLRFDFKFHLICRRFDADILCLKYNCRFLNYDQKMTSCFRFLGQAC
jgi:hypothetical protein